MGKNRNVFFNRIGRLATIAIAGPPKQTRKELFLIENGSGGAGLPIYQRFSFDKLVPENHTEGHRK